MKAFLNLSAKDFMFVMSSTVHTIQYDELIREVLNKYKREPWKWEKNWGNMFSLEMKLPHPWPGLYPQKKPFFHPTLQYLTVYFKMHLVLVFVTQDQLRTTINHGNPILHLGNDVFFIKFYY